jgi:hypothetical protein
LRERATERSSEEVYTHIFGIADLPVPCSKPGGKLEMETLRWELGIPSVPKPFDVASHRSREFTVAADALRAVRRRKNLNRQAKRAVRRRMSMGDACCGMTIVPVRTLIASPRPACQPGWSCAWRRCEEGVGGKGTWTERYSVPAASNEGVSFTAPKEAKSIHTWVQRGVMKPFRKRKARPTGSRGGQPQTGTYNVDLA